MSPKLQYRLYLFIIHCLWSMFGQITMGNRPRDLEKEYHNLSEILEEKIKSL